MPRALLRLPLAHWRGFVRERRWGFSTQSRGDWFLDRLKGLAVAIVLTVAGLFVTKKFVDPSIANAGVLDPYDRVGSIRDHGAGRDPDRLPSVQRRQCGPTRPGLIRDRENHRPARRGAPRVLRPHREAVHRGVVEAGNRVGALHVDGENPSERLAQRDRLRAQRADPLEDETPGVAEGDRLVRRRCRQGALTRLPASRRSP